jgi:hypothetical protein
MLSRGKKEARKFWAQLMTVTTDARGFLLVGKNTTVKAVSVVAVVTAPSVSHKEKRACSRKSAGSSSWWWCNYCYNTAFTTPSGMLQPRQQGNGGGGGSAVCHKLPHSWRRSLSVSMILLVALLRAMISYRELLLSYSMAYQDYDDNVHVVDSTTRWMQTSGMKVTNLPPPPVPGMALRAAENHGENASSKAAVDGSSSSSDSGILTQASLGIVERATRHVEAAAAAPSFTNITAAVCFKTLFGHIDLGLVIQWAGTCVVLLLLSGTHCLSLHVFTHTDTFSDATT